jgi:aminopeptidase-like protein
VILRDLAQRFPRERLAADAAQLMGDLYPLCRSLTGPGLRATLDRIAREVPLQRHEIPTGTPLFDWTTPAEWTIRDAWIAGPDGRRLVDFGAHNLHVVNGSTPVRARLGRAELEPHLHSLPDQPDWIPYRTTYWRADWGFCLRHRDRETLGHGPFEVVIDADLQDGHMSVAECIVPGTTDGIGVVYAHACHPSLANDNLTGLAAATALARALQGSAPRLSWHIVFGPGTLGSLAWLARHEADVPRVRAGFTLGLLGDAHPLTWKCSRRSDTATDRAARSVLGRVAPGHRVLDFEPYGYDERQFCSPGFDLPMGRLSRAQYAEYPQYHTSADDLAFVSAEQVADAVAVAADLLAVLDTNRRVLNLAPRGEPRLGKRGLYGPMGGQTPREAERAMLWVLSGADGERDLVDASQRSGLPFEVIAAATDVLERAGLVCTLEPAPTSERTMS